MVQVGNFGIVLYAIAATALATTGLTSQPVIGLVLISVALAGIYAFTSINPIGNLGGFAGPYAIGYLKDWTGTALGGLLFLSGFQFLSFFMTWFARMLNAP
jgi:ACS family tartrate transporter-like MFS transporter